MDTTRRTRSSSTSPACPRTADLVIWFVKARAELAGRIGAAKRAMAGGGGLWICWPKKTSGVATDLSEGVVRGTVLKAGLVDYKVCAIDETWSGLKFARRAGPQTAGPL
jgi:hypothetical protein